MPLFVPPLIDLAIVVVFAAIGRRSHGEGDALTGIATVAWPFALAALLGWLVVWARWRSVAQGVRLPAGVVIWVMTITAGMLLRHLEGRGVVLSFIIVASIFNGLLMLGWRAVAIRLGRRSHHDKTL